MIVKAAIAIRTTSASKVANENTSARRRRNKYITARDVDTATFAASRSKWIQVVCSPNKAVEVIDFNSPIIIDNPAVQGESSTPRDKDAAAITGCTVSDTTATHCEYCEGGDIGVAKAGVGDGIVNIPRNKDTSAVACRIVVDRTAAAHCKVVDSVSRNKDGSAVACSIVSDRTAAAQCEVSDVGSLNKDGSAVVIVTVLDDRSTCQGKPTTVNIDAAAVFPYVARRAAAVKYYAIAYG